MGEVGAGGAGTRGVRLEVLRVGQAVEGDAMGTEGGCIHTAHIAAAVHGDIDIVGHVGIESGEGDHGVVGIGDRTIGVAWSESCGTIFHSPAGAVAHLSPTDISRTGGDIGHSHILHTGALGLDRKHQVVHRGVPSRAGTHGLDGHKLAVAGKGGEGCNVFIPDGVAANGHGAHLLEGGDIGGVAHHANLEDRIVGGRRGLGPHSHLQGVDGINIGIHCGEDDAVVVAIGARGGAGAPVKALGAAYGVVVARGTANIGITHIAGAVVEVVPAVGPSFVGGVVAGSSLCLEVLRVGQAVEGDAEGAEADRGGHAGVVAAADGIHFGQVGGVGGEACQHDGIFVCVEDHFHGVFHIGDHPLGLGAAGHPADGGIGGGDVAGRHLLCARAGVLAQGDVVDAGAGVGAVAAVVGPAEDKSVGAGGSDVEGARQGVPGAGAVKERAQADPASHILVAEVVGAGLSVGCRGAAGYFCIGGRDEGTQVVVVALARAFPVEAVGDFAGRGHYEVADSVGEHGGVLVIGGGGSAILRDIHGVGSAVSGGSAHSPGILVAAGVEIPADGAFEVVGEGKRGGGHGRGEAQVAVDAGVAVAAVGMEVYVVGEAGGEPVHEVAGVSQCHQVAGRGAGGEVDGVPFHDPAAGGAELGPVEDGGVGGEVVHHQVAGARTGRQVGGEFVVAVLAGPGVVGAAGRGARLMVRGVDQQVVCGAEGKAYLEFIVRGGAVGGAIDEADHVGPFEKVRLHFVYAISIAVGVKRQLDDQHAVGGSAGQFVLDIAARRAVGGKVARERGNHRQVGPRLVGKRSRIAVRDRRGSQVNAAVGVDRPLGVAVSGKVEGEPNVHDTRSGIVLI